MKIKIVLILLITTVCLCSCQIGTEIIPDITPPTGVEIDKDNTDTSKIILNWYLIRDDNTSCYSGVNVYFYESATRDDQYVYNLFLTDWNANDWDNDVKSSMILLNSGGVHPSITNNYYSDSGDKKTKEYTNTYLGLTFQPTYYYYFIMTSFGSYEDSDGVVYLLESQLSNMVAVEYTGTVWNVIEDISYSN